MLKNIVQQKRTQAKLPHANFTQCEAMLLPYYSSIMLIWPFNRKISTD